MAITLEQFVQNEVVYCVSSLVSALASEFGSDLPSRELSGLAEQAFELSSPVPDYEEAAIESGWRLQDGEWTHDDEIETFATAQAACEHRETEPYDREVFEHWIVTNWLAEKLIEKGEKVDKDFAGMTVWARTTTGQAISIDWVIEQIHAELMAG